MPDNRPQGWRGRQSRAASPALQQRQSCSPGQCFLFLSLLCLVPWTSSSPFLILSRVLTSFVLLSLLKDFANFFSYPHLPEGTSPLPDLQEDPDDRDISVASAHSMEDAAEDDGDNDVPLNQRKRGRYAAAKGAVKSTPAAAVMEGSSTSRPPTHSVEEAARASDPTAPPSKRSRPSLDLFDPANLMEISS